MGPLCSSCEHGFVYSTAARGCATCEESIWTECGVALGGLSALAWAFHRKVLVLPRCIEASAVVGVLRMVDSGSFRVTWCGIGVVLL